MFDRKGQCLSKERVQMAIADYNWLRKRAKDLQTKKLTKEILDSRANIVKTGIFPKSKKHYLLKFDNYRIWINRNNALCSLDTFSEIFKEKGHTVLSSFSGKNCKIIVDIGANEGFYVMKVKETNPDVEVFAVEANPLMFKHLRDNIKENKIKKVHLFNKALCSKNGKVKFEIVPEVGAIGALDFRLQPRPWVRDEQIKTVWVNAMTLKKLCKDYFIDKIDILKLDVEGAEYKILKNSKSLLNKIEKIVVEYHSPEIRKNILCFLKKSGFKLIAEKSEGRCGDLYFKKMK